LNRNPARFDRATLRAIPSGIWVLGFVSMLMDVSSEMIHALLPVFLVTVMATSATTVGIIEGIAESTAAITKMFSGALSDWLGKRKLLAVLGYGLAALTKPVFALAPTVGWLVAARFVDRVGKGIRGAPRDALVADLAPAQLRGACFGLRQALDTVGAFVGPLLAIVLMWWSANRFRFVFWMAVLPAFLALLLITVAVREPRQRAAERQVRFPLHRSELARLSRAFWFVIAVAIVFSLARFSEAFLVLRARAVGLPLMWVPLVLVTMNLLYAAGAYPAGVLADRSGRRSVLSVGLIVLILADVTLAFAPGTGGALIGAALWGVHLAFTQGLLAALVADTAPAELRGTAFGMFNLLTGAALLAASIVAGRLWDTVGARATFLAGGVLAMLALLGLSALPAQQLASAGSERE
jgi:MFS family permease